MIKLYSGYHQCCLCRDEVKKLSRIAEQWLIDEIIKDHPDWTTDNGICQKCIDHYYILLDQVQVVS